MVLIYSYLERENYEVLKFHANHFFYFEISGSLGALTRGNTVDHAFFIKLVGTSTLHLSMFKFTNFLSVHKLRH